MATFTPNLNLLKPDPLELVDVVTALNQNLDKLDLFAGAAGLLTKVIKPIDTVRTLTGVPANDPHLTLPVVNGKIYKLEVQLAFAIEKSSAGVGSADNHGFFSNFDVPGAVSTSPYTLRMEGPPPYNLASPTVSWVNEGTLLLGWAAPAINGPATIDYNVQASGLFRPAASGNLVFQWAQGTSHADDVILRAGSCMTLLQLN